MELSDKRTSTSDIPSSKSFVEKELDAIYRVSFMLGQSLDLNDTLEKVLDVLNDDLGLTNGMVAIANEEQSEVKVYVVQGQKEWLKQVGNVRYRTGEGMVGRILASGENIILGQVSQAPEFLHKLDIYDYDLPFIGIAIKGPEGAVRGVISAQPDDSDNETLADKTRFMQMVANLIVNNIQLANRVNHTQANLKEERDELRREVRAKYGFEQMVVGHTAAMRRVFEQVRRVAKWDSTVLIRGESGTGKELIASAIHYNSPRAKKPFVKLNCAALPENLLESELFGHEKGAFTGAVKTRQGRFEQADGGTLFLDEIGEISPVFQAKLLRVLQECELERVGGNHTIRINTRIVTATNRNLEAEVEEGNFREDLYYRLNVMPIFLPPLRERMEDLPELAEFLISKISESQKRNLSITPAAIRALMNHSWPGNVRELENCLERASVMCEVDTIDLDVISLSGLEQRSPSYVTSALHPASAVDLDDDNMDEREKVIAALEQAGWVQARAARLLGMTPRQIAYRIQTLNIHMRKI